MIFETIEVIPTNITTTIDSLRTELNKGKFDDILSNYCFLIFTEKGLTLVKQDKTIVTNAIVDLSAYAKKTDIPNVSKFITSDSLSGYAKTSELPTFAFADDGTLSVTINGITHRYAPITT